MEEVGRYMAPKAGHGKHGEEKSKSLYVRLTPTGKQGLEDKAADLGISVAELLEQIGRGVLSPSSLSGEKAGC